MHLCVDYQKDLSFLAELEEITIDYNNQKKDTLLEFLEDYKDKRINIRIKDPKNFDITIFESIKRDYPHYNIVLLFTEPKDPLVKKALKDVRESEIRIPYFFALVACNWDVLIGLVKQTPCDIYIGENLGFEIDSVASVLHLLGIKVRAYANVAQTSWTDEGIPDIKKFFIRPEDLQLYSPYIDIIEFYAMDRLETYYRIYFIDKKWLGNLNELIIDFKEPIPNNFVSLESRLTCGKRCLKGKPCQVCERAVDLAETLTKENLYLINKEN